MTCSLCSLPIPPLPGSSQIGPTVEHVTPRSLGGSRRASANRSVTHRICNGLKSDTPEDQITPELRAEMVAAVQKRMRVWLLSLSRAERAAWLAGHPVAEGAT